MKICVFLLSLALDQLFLFSKINMETVLLLYIYLIEHMEIVQEEGNNNMLRLSFIIDFMAKCNYLLNYQSELYCLDDIILSDNVL